MPAVLVMDSKFDGHFGVSRATHSQRIPKACGHMWPKLRTLPQFTIIYPCFTVHVSVKTDYPTKSSAEFQNKCGTVWDMQILSDIH